MPDNKVDMICIKKNPFWMLATLLQGQKMILKGKSMKYEKCLWQRKEGWFSECDFNKTKKIMLRSHSKSVSFHFCEGMSPSRNSFTSYRAPFCTKITYLEIRIPQVFLSLFPGAQSAGLSRNRCETAHNLHILYIVSDSGRLIECVEVVRDLTWSNSAGKCNPRTACASTPPAASAWAFRPSASAASLAPKPDLKEPSLMYTRCLRVYMYAGLWVDP